jgi:integrase
MPRKKSPPRLYLDDGQWRIRDGAHRVRTGCLEADCDGAEKRLREYLGEKHEPTPGPDPLIIDILIAYGREHLPGTAAAKNSGYNLTSLGKWWHDKKLSDVNAANCRAYADTKTPAAARRDLEMLRAAIGHWHREHGPLPSVPAVVLPPKAQARDRWLTRSEVAKLLWAARRTPHLRRFILLGFYTGSRSGSLLGLRWDWVNFDTGIMRRRAPRTADRRNKRKPDARLGSRILAHLQRWRRVDDRRCVYVCHYNGQRVNKMRRSWRTAVRLADLSDDVTPHTLRHSKATRLMQQGVDKWEAAGYLGMTMETLERTYGHHHPDYHRDAAEV